MLNTTQIRQDFPILSETIYIGPEESADDLKEMYEFYINGDAEGITAYLNEDVPLGGDGLPIDKVRQQRNEYVP